MSARSPARLLAEPLALVFASWRGAWGAQLLLAAALTPLFVAALGRLDPATAGDLAWIGAAASAVAGLALVGALLRLQLQGAGSRTLGPAGLQLGLVEIQLVCGLLVCLAASLLVWLPVVAIVSAIFVLMHGQGTVAFEGLGAFPVSFLMAGAVVAGAAAAYLYFMVRLSLVGPATVARGRLALASAWRLSHGAEGAIVRGLVASLVPALLLALGVMQLGAAWGWGWPWEDAVAVAAFCAAAISFVQLPLTLGVLGAACRVQDGGPLRREPSEASQRLQTAFSALRV